MSFMRSTAPTKTMAWLLAALFALGAFALAEQNAAAKDVRVAVLVGNQKGWTSDPFLRYALRGDLQPFGRLLRQVGFQVIALQNQSSQELRKTLRRMQRRLTTSPRVTTFLFYYTGHADKQGFHMGPKSKRPFTYKELAHFLRKLPVKRRFAILDACFSGEVIREFGSMKQFRDLVRKGVRQIKSFDISKNFPTQGEEQGLQIISSSLESAWESKRYQASIFTHHLLKGLRGPADRDNDGKISIDELFSYTSQAMARETRQKPYIFGIYRRASTYALAPAYRSRLWIGPQIVGRLHVSVANFFWTRNKHKQRALRLAVVPGKGVVDLRKDNRCWRQQIRIPKGREARLSDRWKSVRCAKVASQRKGAIELPAAVIEPLPARHSHQLEWFGGARQMGLLKGALLGGGQMGWRLGFVGLRLGLWGTSLPYQPQQPPLSQLFVELQAEAGYRHNVHRFDLFVGAFAGYGILVQDINQQPAAGGIFGYGATLQLGVWLTERIALSLRSNAGFQLARLGFAWEHRFSWQISTGLCFRLNVPLSAPTPQ